MADIEIKDISASNMATLVDAAFTTSLFKDDEDKSNFIPVTGITCNIGFHPERLESQRELVTALVAELPAEFKEGYTFLNLCMTKNGEQWTGMHRTCEKLMLMAIGLKLMSYCFPKELWPALPGSVPYIIVN